MQDPFRVLGLPPNADEKAVRAAYRAEVKKCHPDQFQDEDEQRAAQGQLTLLNIAYQEALKRTSAHQIGYSMVSVDTALMLAQKMLDQNSPEKALRQLGRAESRTAQWYYAQGRILESLHQYDTACQSYREAVHMEPENMGYRRAALDAETRRKKAATFPYIIGEWIHKIL